MRSLRYCLVCAVMLILCAVQGFAQIKPSIKSSGAPLSYYLPTTITYNPAVPTPESFFGFNVGDWHLRHDQIVAYLQKLAQTSTRVQLQEYGTSYEQRPLVLLTISTPENLKDIERLKREHKQLADPTKSATLNTATMPVFTWLGYSVHGNELSGLNAVPHVAYYLAAAQTPEVETMLKNMIILLDACLNPDGASRFTQWANTHRGVNAIADPQHREHNEGWLSGRFNHYWFDPNRDWLPLQHPEARARVEKFHEWLPNVLTDHHEMGAKNAMFFFQPAAPSRNNPHVPEKVYDFTRMLAKFHASALDSIGSLYFTKEYYDDYYVGKGATYGDLNGGVAILFEQGSTRGHAMETDNGTLTFASTIRNQVLASFSTLKGALSLRKDLLDHQRNFYNSALPEAEKAVVKGYVIGSSSDQARNYHLLDILRRHQIQVYDLAKRTTLEGKTFEPGMAYIIPTAQPQYRLLTALFEKRTSFQDSVFYDISAWTLPLAFGLPYVELKVKPTSDIMGKMLEMQEFPKGSLVGNNTGNNMGNILGGKSQLYAFEWKGYYAPRALYRLLQAGVIAKTATKPFTALIANGSADGSKKQFGYGSIVVSVGIQQERSAEIASLLETIAREDALTVYALKTGLAEAGIDAGSRNIVTVEKPRVMMLVGSGASGAAGVMPADAGEIWHLLDKRMGMDVSIVEMSALPRTNLERYTTIILPSGNYNSLSKAATESLKDWTERGGVLVGVEDATEWLVKQEFLKAELRTNKENPPATVMRRDYADVEQDQGARNLDGAIFEAKLDITHPLGYGYEDRSIAVFRSNTIFLEPSKNPYATPLAYTASPLLSGYIHKDHEKLLKNAGDILVSSLKSGRVIGFTSNPNFRAFWFGTNKLFLNAMFFGHIISNSASLQGGKITDD